MSANPQNGLIHLPSKYSVEQTMQRLEALLQERGVMIFARIDHSGEAAKARPDDASHQAADLWQPQRRNSADAGCSQHRHRLAAESLVLGRCRRESLAHLQRPCLPCSSGTMFPPELLPNIAGVSALFAKAVE